MAGKIKILYIEDDSNLGYILSEYLQMKGFDITWAKNGKAGLDFLHNTSFDVCLIDIMLPDMDGFSFAEQVNQSSMPVPFIFLTAKSLKVDKLKGFKSGCDDYITKPVDEEELIARINVVVKRNSFANKLPVNQSLRFGNVVFNFQLRRLTIHQTEYKLTGKEAEVLQLLAGTRNTLLAREVVLKKVWGSNDYFNRRSMDVIISRLRKRLSADENVKIVNIHNKGYMLKVE